MGEGEADAEPADEDGGAGPALLGERVEGRVDQEPLGAPVGGVHQEGAVGDDLVVLVAAPQDDLSVGSFAPVEGHGS